MTLFASTRAAAKEVFPCFLGKKISASVKRLIFVPGQKKPNRFTTTKICQSVRIMSRPRMGRPSMSSPLTFFTQVSM